MTRRLHLLTGLILFSYLLVHFMNHALLLVSTSTADAFLHAIYPVITSAPVTALLLDAALIHLALALWALWRRRSLHFTGYEALQYLLGFLLPLLLLPHVAGTRVADSAFGVAWGYYRNVMLHFWWLDPWAALYQGALVLVAWTHACIGLRFWLRLKPWFPAARAGLFAAALLVPALALAGFVAGGNEVRLSLAADPDLLPRIMAHHASAETASTLALGVQRIRLALLLAVAAVFVARAIRGQVERQRGLVRITYLGGRRIRVPRGYSVLEASQRLGVPHAAVCGGRGRCSTCRVRVVAAAPGALPAPGPDESRVLRRIAAPTEVRLACQLRPLGAVTVAPLLDATLPAGALLRFRAQHQMGEERSIVIAFIDIREFTRIAERRLPFDVVHLLNRYFRTMGEAVEAAGGVVDKFIGDGVMALFGTEGPEDSAAACRAALAAARDMALRLEAMNESLLAELGEPLRIGIGLHLGPVILGNLGHGRTVGLTAIGDAVNTASRLEAACKEFACELVVSEAVLQGAGLQAEGEPHALTVRGRAQPLAVRAFARAAELPLLQTSSTMPS